MKYQSSSTHCSKVISKVKVLKNGQTPRSRSQGQKSGKKWYKREGLITGNIHVKYQTLAHTVQKLLARLKYSKNASNSKVKVTG